MSDNLKVWNELSHTDPKYTKPFDRGGFKGTATNPTWQLKRLTEVFGPIGFGWYYEVSDIQTHKADTGHIMIYLGLNLFVKQDNEWSKPIHGRGGDFVVTINKNGMKSDDEAFKKAETDALGNAMKKLGMSADVHMGMFDDNKYVNDMRQKFGEQEEPKFTREDKITQVELIDTINHIKTPNQIDAWWEKYSGHVEALPEVFQTTIQSQLDNKLAQLENGIVPPELFFAFVDVEHSKDYFDKFMAWVGTASEKLILDRQARDEHKIKAIDVSLKAAKYQEAGISPANRLRKAMNDRVMELKQQTGEVK